MLFTDAGGGGTETSMNYTIGWCAIFMREEDGGLDFTTSLAKVQVPKMDAGKSHKVELQAAKAVFDNLINKGWPNESIYLCVTLQWCPRTKIVM